MLYLKVAEEIQRCSNKRATSLPEECSIVVDRHSNGKSRSQCYIAEGCYVHLIILT